MLESLARLALHLLDRIGWDAVATPGRIWTPSDAPALSLMRPDGGGFALALGRWEVTVSPKEYRPRA